MVEFAQLDAEKRFGFNFRRRMAIAAQARQTSAWLTQSARRALICSVMGVARGLRGGRVRAESLSEIISVFPPWYFILLAVGIFDALLQWSDYRAWRREQAESGEVE